MKTKKLKSILLRELIEWKNIHQLANRILEGKISTLESQNKALQEECGKSSMDYANRILKLQYENEALNKAQDVMMDEGRKLREKNKQLQSVVDCFESLKSEMGSFSKSYTVWIARDRNGETWVFNKKPILHNETTWVSDTFYKKKKTSKDERISFLAKIEDFIDLQPLECKKFKLLEINKP